MKDVSSYRADKEMLTRKAQNLKCVKITQICSIRDQTFANLDD